MSGRSAERWANHFIRMGNFKKARNFYTVSPYNQTGNGMIQLVSPTQQQVEQARLSVKRKASTSRTAPSKKRKVNKKKPAKKKSQSTRGRKKGNTKKGKKVTGKTAKKSNRKPKF